MIIPEIVRDLEKGEAILSSCLPFRHQPGNLLIGIDKAGFTLNP